MSLFAKSLFVLVVLWALYMLAILLKYLMMWRAARQAGTPLGLMDVIKMRWRQVDPRQIIEACHLANEGELDLDVEQIERHYKRGGRVIQVVEALRMARSRQLRTTWDQLCRQDLNGENVVQAINKRIEELKRRE